MTRRLTTTILGVVVATLVVTGLGTLLLSRLDSRATTEADLRSQSAGSAAMLQAAGRVIDASLQRNGIAPADRPNPRVRLAAVRRALDLEDMDVVVFDASDQLDTSLGEPYPGPVRLDADELAALRDGETVSGSAGRYVYAATAFGPLDGSGEIAEGGYVAAVLLTREPQNEATGAWRWFVLSATASVVVALLATTSLSRRLTKPLRAATDVTTRVAGGDLAARVPETPDRGGAELGELGRSINAMAGALERSRVLEQQFLLSVSHDLRTPLTSIRGYAEAIADGTAGDGVAAAEIILSEARRLDRLVRDLLDLARLEARQFSLHPTLVDLGALVAGVADGFRPDLEGTGVTLSVELPPSAIRCDADPDRLSQVVGNLAENALKYAATEVRIVVGDDASNPTVEVIDDGAGIPAADVPHVFERLYQTQARPRRKETGSGLGLAIVWELTTAMGGTVTVTSAEGLGTRMVVRMPGTDQPPPAPSGDEGQPADLGGR